MANLDILSADEINTFAVWVDRLNRKSHPQDEERVIAYILNQSSRIALTLKTLNRQMEAYRRKEMALQEREVCLGASMRITQSPKMDYSFLSDLTPAEIQRLSDLIDDWKRAGPQSDCWLRFINALLTGVRKRDEICVRSGLSVVTVQRYVGITLYYIQQWRQQNEE